MDNDTFFKNREILNNEMIPYLKKYNIANTKMTNALYKGFFPKIKLANKYFHEMDNISDNMIENCLKVVDHHDYQNKEYLWQMRKKLNQKSVTALRFLLKAKTNRKTLVLFLMLNLAIDILWITFVIVQFSSK